LPSPMLTGSRHLCETNMVIGVKYGPRSELTSSYTFTHRETASYHSPLAPTSRHTSRQGTYDPYHTTLLAPNPCRVWYGECQVITRHQTSSDSPQSECIAESFLVAIEPGTLQDLAGRKNQKGRNWLVGDHGTMPAVQALQARLTVAPASD
jgi:hypothetical protein